MVTPGLQLVKYHLIQTRSTYRIHRRFSLQANKPTHRWIEARKQFMDSYATNSCITNKQYIILHGVISDMKAAGLVDTYQRLSYVTGYRNADPRIGYIPSATSLAQALITKVLESSHKSRVFFSDIHLSDFYIKLLLAAAFHLHIGYFIRFINNIRTWLLCSVFRTRWIRVRHLITATP